MSGKFTPGPWLVHDKSTLHMQDRCIANVGRHIKIVSHEHHVESEHANAVLIAAAPRLLASCEAAAETLFNVHVADCDMQQEKGINECVYCHEWRALVGTIKEVKARL